MSGIFSEYLLNPKSTTSLTWNGDEFSKSRKSDEERVAEVVKKAVDDLPSLQHLQLGDFCPPWDETDTWLPDIWGKALRYVQVVEERYEQRLMDEDKSVIFITGIPRPKSGRENPTRGTKKKNKRAKRGNICAG